MDVTGISIRKDELTSTIEAMEGEHATAEQAARAVLRVALQALWQRDWWLVVSTDLRLTYGVYATENAAVKAARSNELGLIGQVRVLPVLSAEKRTTYVEEN